MKKNVISELELKKRLVLQVLLRQQHLHHGVQIQNPVDSLANLLSGQYIILIYLSCVEHRGPARFLVDFWHIERKISID